MNAIIKNKINDIILDYLRGFYNEIYHEIFVLFVGGVKFNEEIWQTYHDAFMCKLKEPGLPSRTRFAVNKIIQIMDYYKSLAQQSYDKYGFFRRHDYTDGLIQIIYEGQDDYRAVIEKYNAKRETSTKISPYKELLEYDIQNDEIKICIGHYLFLLNELCNKKESDRIEKVIEYAFECGELNKSSELINGVYDKEILSFLSKALNGFSFDHDYDGGVWQKYSPKTIQRFIELFDFVSNIVRRMDNVRVNIGASYNYLSSEIAEAFIAYYFRNDDIDNAVLNYSKYYKMLKKPFQIIKNIANRISDPDHFSLIIGHLFTEKQIRDNIIDHYITDFPSVLEREKEICRFWNAKEPVFDYAPQKMSASDYIDLTNNILNQLLNEEYIDAYEFSKEMQRFLLYMEYYNDLDEFIEEIQSKYLNSLILNNNKVIDKLIKDNQIAYDEPALIRKIIQKFRQLKRNIITGDSFNNNKFDEQDFCDNVLNNNSFFDFRNALLTGFWIYENQYPVSKQDSKLELTFIIAPFLKSIELFLTEYINQKHKVINVHIIKSGNSGKTMILSLNNQDWREKITLGNMLHHIYENQYCKNALDNVKVFKYLKNWIDNIRNGYFHKHVLYDDILCHEIVNKTLALIKYLFVDLI